MVGDIFIGIGLLCATLFIVLFVWEINKNICRHDWGKWEYSEGAHVFYHKRRCSKCGLHDIKQILKLWS